MASTANDWYDYDQEEQDRLAEARRRKREELLARLNEPAIPPDVPAVVPSTVTVQSNVSAAPGPKRPREPDGSPLAPKTADVIVNSSLTTRHAQEESGAESEDEDMFALGSTSSASPVQAAKEKGQKDGKVTHHTKDAHGTTAQQGTGRAVAANSADDAEGYYPLTLGEALDAGRYVVEANLGKGMFSSVVRARDTTQQGEMVAIKIVRSQESMYKAGLREAGMLERLLQADPQDKGHVVRLLRQFVHRGHLCLVFESLSMNLRQVVKRFGQGVGLHIEGVRSYAYQSLLALNLLSKAGIVHADLKPDNILVTESKAALKVCDLGSAGDAPADATTGVPSGGKRVMEIAPYLVSRFYRAPEIMLGSGPPGCGIDMWSLGCTLFELYTARILFPGRSNNHMLYLFQRLCGRFPTRMARRGQFARMHFDDLGNFLLRDSGTVKSIVFNRPEENMRTRLGLTHRGAKSNADNHSSSKAVITPPPPVTADERLLVERLASLLERMLELDPTKRISPKEALVHPFFAAHHPPTSTV